MSSVTTIVLKWEKEAEEWVSEWCNVKKIWLNITGLEDGKESWAKECGWPLKTGKGKKTDSSLEPPEGIQPCWHLDFSPLRLISDFWPPEL